MNNGQLAQVESWIGTEKQYRQQYFYDTLGRLKESIEKYGTSLASTAYDVKYRYDEFGNRQQREADNTGNSAITQKWVESGDISTSTNRYASNVTYDAAGNITADPKFRNKLYSYDANGRQTYAANANGGNPVTAIFDGVGQRVANKASGVTTIMVYDAGGKLAAEYGATAPSTANLQYVTADYQGSTRVVTDSAGAVANRRDYLQFGEEIGATVGSRAGKGFGTGDGVRQKYAGMETDDATLMSHTLWRKQDNLSGRWTSPDPYGGSMQVGDPQTFNRYAYVSNDPTNHTDSLGLALSDIGIYQTDNPAVSHELESEMLRRFTLITNPQQEQTPAQKQPQQGQQKPTNPFGAFILPQTNPVTVPGFPTPSLPSPSQVPSAAAETYGVNAAFKTVFRVLGVVATVLFSPATVQAPTRGSERNDVTGVAIIRYFAPGKVGRFAHYSITVVTKKESLSSELVDYPDSVIRGGPAGTGIPSILYEGTSTHTVALPNAVAAQAYQRSVIGQRSRYSFQLNSCVTHVGNVLRQGGVEMGTTSSEILRNFSKFGIPNTWR